MPTNDVRADGALLSACWESPDLSILTDPDEAPPFPLEVLGPWEREVVRNAEVTASPVDYSAVALLGTAAGLIGNSRAVRVWQNWIEACALWFALVGVPSSMKSPPLAAFRGLVHELQAEQVAVWESGGKETGQPKPRLTSDDTTPEEFCSVLAGTSRFVFLPDELSRLIKSTRRYGASTMDGMLLEGFGGRPYTVDRVKDGARHIEHLLVNITGAIQPETFCKLLIDRTDGLGARFIPVQPSPVPARRPRSAPDRDWMRDGLRRLVTLEPDGAHPVVLDCTAAAADLFERWWVPHSAETRTRRGRLAENYNKAAGMVLRHSLVLQNLWWTPDEAAPPPTEISETAVAAALALAEGYYKPMAKRVYGVAGRSERDLRARALAEWIAESKLRVVNARVIGRSAGIEGLREPKAVDEAIKDLAEAGCLRREPHTGIGRRRKDYEVNPVVLAWQEGRR